MTPFDKAWTVLKGNFTKPSEVRAGGAGGAAGEYYTPDSRNAGAWTHPANIYAEHKNFYPFGLSREGVESSLANMIVGTDTHETMHQAMDSIGENYDSGIHEEYAPHLAENLVQSRMPGIKGGMSNQLMRLIQGVDYRGIEPRPDTQAAMEYTRQQAIRDGFNHPKVRKPREGESDESPDSPAFKIRYGSPPKPEFWTGYGEDTE